MASLPENDYLPEFSTDELVSSIEQRKRGFLLRLESWRKSRLQCMNIANGETSALPCLIHVVRFTDSSTQTDPHQDAPPIMKTAYATNECTRFNNTCPIVSEYLHECLNSVLGCTPNFPRFQYGFPVSVPSTPNK